MINENPNLKMETCQEEVIEPRNKNISTLHWISTSSTILLGMIILDGYLVEQNTGNRRTGVLVMLVIGEICLCLALRYTGGWIASEVKTTKRACAMVEWFVFVAIFDVKVYFILSGMRKNDAPDPMAKTAQLLPTSNSIVSDSLYNKDITKPNVKLSNVLEQYSDALKSMDELITKEYSLTAKKMLTLSQAVVLTGMYMLLVGADYVKSISELRELEEIKMRAFWIMLDIADILDLQSTAWEAESLPESVRNVLFFYGYVVLIILPPLSFVEMGRKDGKLRPHAMIIYLIASLISINIVSTIFRLLLVFKYSFSSSSSIFIGKNIVCFGMKITKLIQIRLARKQGLCRGEEEASSETSSDRNEVHEHVLMNGGSTIKTNTANDDDDGTEENLRYDFQHQCRSCSFEFNPGGSSLLDRSIFKDYDKKSESTTPSKHHTSSPSQATTIGTSQTNLENRRLFLQYDTSSKRVKFNGKRQKVDENNIWLGSSHGAESEKIFHNIGRGRSKTLNAEDKASVLVGQLPLRVSATLDSRKTLPCCSKNKTLPVDLSNHILNPPDQFANFASDKITRRRMNLPHVATSPGLLCANFPSPRLPHENSKQHSSLSLENLTSATGDYTMDSAHGDIRFDCENDQYAIALTNDLVQRIISTDSDISDCTMPPPCPTLCPITCGNNSPQTTLSEAENTSV